MRVLGRDLELVSFLCLRLLCRNALLLLSELLLPCHGFPSLLETDLPPEFLSALSSETNEFSKPVTSLLGEFFDHGWLQSVGLGEFFGKSSKDAKFGDGVDTVGDFLEEMIALVKKNLF